MSNAAIHARVCRAGLCGWLALLLQLFAARQGALAASEAVCGKSKAGDLTGLSLSELYNLDVIQLNVLGGHTHPAGQAMFGYQFMHMNMGELHQGTKVISAADIFANTPFTTAHILMEMDMHMFEFMYAPSDGLTLMAMLPYKEMSMLHQVNTGARFTQRASGIGDVEVMALWTLLGDIRKGGHRLILNAGLSLPSGSIDVTDHRSGNPALPMVQLEYPMQLGSGTFDLMPGLTYVGESGHWSWGAQTIETLRLGENDADYTYGNQYRLSAWLAYGITDWCAPSVRLDGRWWEDVAGADPRLASNTTPESRPNLQGGRRLDLLFGLNLYAPGGMIKGNRLMIEGGFPVYQNLDGPQLGMSWIINIGWNYAF